MRVGAISNTSISFVCLLSPYVWVTAPPPKARQCAVLLHQRFEFLQELFHGLGGNAGKVLLREPCVEVPVFCKMRAFFVCILPLARRPVCLAEWKRSEKPPHFNPTVSAPACFSAVLKAPIAPAKLLKLRLPFALKYLTERHDSDLSTFGYVILN
jgi:hypothetical protein